MGFNPPNYFVQAGSGWLAGEANELFLLLFGSDCVTQNFLNENFDAKIIA